MSDKTNKTSPSPRGKYAQAQPTMAKVPSNVAFDSAPVKAEAAGSPIRFDSASVMPLKPNATPVAAASARQVLDSKLSSVASVHTVDSAVFSGTTEYTGSTGTASASLDQKDLGLETLLTDFKRLPVPSGDKGRKQELMQIPPATDVAASCRGNPTADEGVYTVESAPFFGSAASVTSAAPSDSVEALKAKLRVYELAVKKAVHCVAFTGDADRAMRVLVRDCPGVQLAPDCAKYQEIPLGQAALRGHVGWALEFLASADAAERAQPGFAGRVLSHRNSARHTLLMLAVDLLEPDGAEAAGSDVKDLAERQKLLVRMLSNRPAQVHECYDAEGRNVLHHCAADNRPGALRLILTWLAENAPQCVGQVAAALRMPDGRCRTPIHYMAEVGSVAMLQAVADFAKATGVTVDYNWRWPVAFDRTPLMLAAAGGHTDVCRWLLPLVGDMDGTVQAAAKAGHASLAELLLKSANSPPRALASEDDSDGDGGYEEDEPEEESDDGGDKDADASTETSALPPPNDLASLSSEARARLCSGLRAAGSYDKFLDLLKRRVPELTASNPGFLDLSADPVFLSISLMAGRNMPAASRQLLGRLLTKLELPDLARELHLLEPEC